MEDDRPVIVGANVSVIEQVPNEIYMTQNNYGDNFKVLNHIPSTGQWGGSEERPVENYSYMNQVQFLINQGGNFDVFDTARSCIVMRHKMILNVSAQAASLTQDVDKAHMGPGKLILKDGAWWWARCKTKVKVDTTGTPVLAADGYDYDHFEEPVALALSPMNAFAPIELTTFEMSGLNARDDNKRFTSCFLQACLSREYQETNSDVWFGGYVNEWLVNTNDYVLEERATFDPTAAKAPGLYVAYGNTKGENYTGAAAANYVFYMTTTMPLCLLNNVLENSVNGNILPKFLVGNNQWFTLKLEFVKAAVRNVWGDSTLFAAGTGVVSIHMDLYTINQSAVKSDGEGSSNYIIAGWKYNFDTQAAQKIQEHGNLMLQVGAKSTNLVGVMGIQTDQGIEKSVNYKQRFTFLQWDAILNFYNHKNRLLQNKVAVGFYQTELQRKGPGDKVFSALVDDLEDQYRMFCEWFKVKSQYSQGLAPQVDTLQKWMCNMYGVCYNLQNFSYIAQDVIMDGANTFQNKLRFLYSIGIHNNREPTSQGKIEDLAAKRNDENYPLIGDSNYGDVATSSYWNIGLLSTYDQFVNYDPNTSMSRVYDSPGAFANTELVQ